MQSCLFVLVLVLGACGDDGGTTTTPEHNPLGYGDTILPFPSSLYELDDAASPTGVDLDVPVGAFPANHTTGVAFDPSRLAQRHGWSPAVTLLWSAPGGVDPTTLTGQDALATSVTPASSTVLYDLTTSAFVAHFAEVDANELKNADRQAVYLRPAQRLLGGHRYAVAITTAVHARDGSALSRSAGFQAVLDDRDTGHVRLDRARARVRTAISALEAAGIARDKLLVAWDFTINDDATTIHDTVAARDAAVAAIGGGAMGYTVTSDLGTVNADPRIARRLEIDFEAPAVTGAALAGFHRDGSGEVVAQGTMTAHAYIMVPPCATSANKAGVVLFGHGFFGGLPEARDDEYLRTLMTRDGGCLIVAATVWVGMAQDDIPNAVLALNDLNQAWGLGERVFQGVVNNIALETLVRSRLSGEVLVDNGGSIVDPTHVAFLGISMGHILGSVFMAYDQHVMRGVLHVGAANWSLLFERSVHWALYGVPFKGSYADLLEADIMEQILEMAMEPADGATVAGITVPNTPAKQLLMMTSLHDAAVPNLAGFYQARSLGLSLLEPSSVTVPYGFTTGGTPDLAHAYIIVDEHPTPEPPTDNEVFSEDNPAHDNPRHRDALQQMMTGFWATGSATQTCTGACDCTAGNCGSLEHPMYGGQ